MHESEAMRDLSSQTRKHVGSQGHKTDGTWRPYMLQQAHNLCLLPIPVIDDVLQRDIYAGFWQLGVNEEDIQKTTKTPPQHFREPWKKYLKTFYKFVVRSILTISSSIPRQKKNIQITYKKCSTSSNEQGLA